MSSRGTDIGRGMTLALACLAICVTTGVFTWFVCVILFDGPMAARKSLGAAKEAAEAVPERLYPITDRTIKVTKIEPYRYKFDGSEGFIATIELKPGDFDVERMNRIGYTVYSSYPLWHCIQTVCEPGSSFIDYFSSHYHMNGFFEWTEAPSTIKLQFYFHQMKTDENDKLPYKTTPPSVLPTLAELNDFTIFRLTCEQYTARQLQLHRFMDEAFEIRSTVTDNNNHRITGVAGFDYMQEPVEIMLWKDLPDCPETLEKVRALSKKYNIPFKLTYRSWYGEDDKREEGP